MRALELWSRVTSSFAVRGPEKLGKRLAVSLLAGVPAGLAVTSLPARVRGPFLPAALASTLLVLFLPELPRWVRAALGVAFLALAFGVGDELPSLLVLPALLGLVLFFEGKPSWARAFAFVVGPVLGAAWHQGLLELVHPWSPASRALELALRASGGLFLGVGLAAAHVEWVGDRVAERLADGRAGEVWQRVQAALARLARGPSRTKLEAHVREVVERYLALVAEASAVRDAIASVDVAHVQKELKALAQRAEAAEDSGARAHLHQAMRVHKDTLEQADGLQRQRERVEAMASAELARLERAALSLELAPASGALSGVVERLEALAREDAA